jgi:hypothetical protein
MSLFFRVVERVLINCQNDVCHACMTLLRNIKVTGCFCWALVKQDSLFFINFEAVVINARCRGRVTT